MYTQRLVIQDLEQHMPARIIQSVSALVARGTFTRFRAAVAYARKSGCEDLVDALSRQSQQWAALRKEWLVSIDFGITTPEALEFLRDLQNSSVHVSDGDAVLARGLKPERCFHAKTYVFDDSDQGCEGDCAMFCGSANLTQSGLLTGSEHGVELVWQRPLEDSEKESLQESLKSLAWWDSAWKDATSLSSDFIRKYRKARPKRDGEDDARSIRNLIPTSKSAIPAADALAWSTARCFWVETYELNKNLGPHKPGNQIDLTRGTRVFFGFSAETVPKNTTLGTVVLQYESHTPFESTVRFSDNSMDKINLPVPDAEGPPDYDNSYVHFERVKADRFRVSLAEKGDHEKWREKSERQGMLCKFSGGREYGFYS